MTVIGTVTVGLVAVLSIGLAENAPARLPSHAKHPATYVVLNPSNVQVVALDPGVTVVLNPSTGQVVTVLSHGVKSERPVIINPSTGQVLSVSS